MGEKHYPWLKYENTRISGGRPEFYILNNGTMNHDVAVTLEEAMATIVDPDESYGLYDGITCASNDECYLYSIENKGEWETRDLEESHGETTYIYSCSDTLPAGRDPVVAMQGPSYVGIERMEPLWEDTDYKTGEVKALSMDWNKQAGERHEAIHCSHIPGHSGKPNECIENAYDCLPNSDRFWYEDLPRCNQTLRHTRNPDTFGGDSCDMHSKSGLWDGTW